VNQTILLVEDNPDDAALTLRALGKTTPIPPVVIARDGAEAIDFLFGTGDFLGRGSVATPVLVLLDLKLPKVHGLEVLRRIREDAGTRILPVVVFTSSTEEQDIIDAYSLGANAYVSKPVEYSLFCQRIKEILSYWLVSSRLPVPFTGTLTMNAATPDICAAEARCDSLPGPAT
jgi:two-component system, response regulator